ncbi:peptidoglycan DD-metalloendopeptidase family protein [Leptolyngbya sp. AN03gr2]|uniref:peptidoglycan DD-metalloendopeptidase family protein n=1 Tax=unclassified Leptolyngbya TaxID=2650499 RepID=UPI003D320E18
MASSIKLGSVYFDSSINLSGVDESLKKARKKLEDQKFVFAVEIDTKNFLKQLDRAERSFEKAGQKHAGQYNQGFTSRLGITDAIEKKLERLDKKSASAGDRSGRSYSSSFNRAASVLPQINTSGSAAAGRQAAAGFNTGFNNGTRSGISAGSVFGNITSGVGAVARGAASIFSGAFRGLFTAAGMFGNVLSGIAGVAGSITSAITSPLRAGLENVFLGFTATIGSSITTSITQGVQSGLSAVKDAYVNTIKAATNEAIQSAKLASQIAISTQQSAQLAYANSTDAEKAGRSPEQYNKAFLDAAIAAGGDPNQIISAKQATDIISVLSKALPGSNVLPLLKPISQLASSLNEQDRGKVATQVASAVSPFDIRGDKALTKATNQLFVASTLTKSSLEDLTTSIKYIRTETGDGSSFTEYLKLLSRLGRLGIDSSTAGVGLTQFYSRSNQAAGVLGVDGKQLLGKSIEETLDILLGAYRKKIQAFGGANTQDSKNLELSLRKALQERASGIFFKANVSRERETRDREVINARYGAIDRGANPLDENNRKLAAGVASQLEILSSSVETIRLQIGQATLPVVAGIAKTLSTGIGELLKLPGWQKFTETGTRFFDAVSKAIANTKVFSPLLETANRIIGDVTRNIDRVTGQLQKPNALEAVVTRIAGIVEMAYGIFKGITSSLFEVATNTPTGANLFDLKSAQEFRANARKTGEEIGSGLVSWTGKLIDFAKKIPGYLEKGEGLLNKWMPLLDKIHRTFSGIFGVVEGVVNSTRNVFKQATDFINYSISKLPQLDYKTLEVKDGKVTGLGDGRGNAVDFLKSQLGAALQVADPVGAFMTGFRSNETGAGQEIANQASYKMLNGISDLMIRIAPMANEFFNQIGRFSAAVLPPLLTTAEKLFNIAAPLFRILGSGLNAAIAVLTPVAQILLPIINTGLEGVAIVLNKIADYAEWSNGLIVQAANNLSDRIRPFVDYMNVNVNNFFPAIGNGFKFAGEVVVGFFSLIGNLLRDTTTQILGFFGWVGKGVIDIGTGIWNGITGAFSSIGNWLFGGAAQAAEAPATSAGQSAGSALATGVEQGASSAGGSWINTLVTNFQNGIGSIGQFIINGFKWYFNTVTGFWMDVFNTIWNGIQFIGGSGLKWLTDAVKFMFDGVVGFWTNVFTTVWNNITWLGGTGLKWLTDTVKFLFDNVTSFWTNVFNSIWGGITQVGSKLLPWLQGVFGGVFTNVQNAWQGVVKYVSETFTWLGNRLYEAFKPVLTWFGGQFKSAFDYAKGLLGLNKDDNTNAGGNGGSVSNPNSELHNLAAISILEAGYGKRQGQVDVAQSILNRTKNNFSGFGTTVKDQVYASGQYQPFFDVKKGTTDSREGAINLIASRLGISKAQAAKELDAFLAAATNPQMVNAARSLVGARTDFKGTTQYHTMLPGDKLRQQGDNFFHYAPGTSASQWKQGDRLDSFVQQNAKVTAANAGAMAGGVANAVNTRGFQLWTTGGGSQLYSGTLRPHHNMNGAYNTSTPGITKNSLGQGVYDMTLVTSSGSDAAPVPSPVSGRVTFAGIKGGYGNTVMINDGKEEILLAHLRSIGVKVGQQVQFGQKVGIQGGTGSGGAQAYAVHLHLEASPGVAKRYADAIKNNRFGVASKGGGGDRPEVQFDESKYTVGTDSKVVGTRSTAGIGSAVTTGVSSGGGDAKPIGASIASSVISGGIGGGGSTGTFLKLTDTGRKDSKGLNLLKMDLVDRATGRVLDSVLTNSGNPNTQVFTQSNSRNALPGSNAPIPVGSYAIGNTYQVNDNPGINGMFVDLKGAGNNVKGRSDFGIHFDADRLSKPGSSGCIVVFDQASKSKVAAWLQGQNKPTELKVQYGNVQNIVPKQNQPYKISTPVAVKQSKNVPQPKAITLSSTSAAAPSVSSAQQSAAQKTIDDKQLQLQRLSQQQRTLMNTLTKREQDAVNVIERQLNTVLNLKAKRDPGYNNAVLAFDRIVNEQTAKILTQGAKTKVATLVNQRLKLALDIADRKSKIVQPKASGLIKFSDDIVAASIPKNNIVPKPTTTGVQLNENETLLLYGASDAIKKLYDSVETQRVALTKLKTGTEQYGKAQAAYNRDLALLPLGLQDAQRSKATATENLTKLTSLVPGLTGLPLSLPLNSLQKIEKQQDLDKVAADIREENGKLSDRRKQLAAVEVEFNSVRQQEAAFVKSLTALEQKAYADLDLQRQQLDRLPQNTKAQIELKAKAEAIYKQNLDNLGKTVLTGGAADRLKKFQEDKKKTNDAVVNARKDLKAQSDDNAKAQRDRELARRKEQISEAGDEFNLLRRYLEARGIGATDDELLKILTLAEQIDQNEKAITPSSLKESTRKALAQLNILQGGSFDASKLGGLGGNFFGTGGVSGMLTKNKPNTVPATALQMLYNSNLSPASTMADFYSRGSSQPDLEPYPRMSRKDLEATLPYRDSKRSGGGGSNMTVRYITDPDGNKFVRQEDFEKLANSHGELRSWADSPWYVDDISDAVVMKLQNDYITRNRLGF